MIGRGCTGWQTILADLSLILFMVAVATVSGADDAAHSVQEIGEPVAYFRETPSAPTMSQWLAEQQDDGRQQLTMTVQYPPGELAAALDKAATLVRADAAGAGHAVRLVIEPGAGGVSAVLAYDRSDGGMARTSTNEQNERTMR